MHSAQHSLSQRFRAPRGFNLLELLVAVAVIAVMAAIALPMLGSSHDAAQEARFRRNAQELAGIFATAKAAGLNFTVSGNKEATIRKIVNGEDVLKGVFQGQRFQLPGLKDEDITAVQKYLEWQGNNLVYSYDAVSNP